MIVDCKKHYYRLFAFNFNFLKHAYDAYENNGDEIMKKEIDGLDQRFLCLFIRQTKHYLKSTFNFNILYISHRGYFTDKQGI